MSEVAPITVDVVSDVVCPWCYIGKKRLERALEMASDIQVELRWRPYQLDPTIPAGGLNGGPTCWRSSAARRSSGKSISGSNRPDVTSGSHSVSMRSWSRRTRSTPTGSSAGLARVEAPARLR